MLCHNEIPINFYIQRAAEFMHSDLEKTEDELRKYIGVVDDQQYQELMKNEGFNNIVTITIKN